MGIFILKDGELRKMIVSLAIFGVVCGSIQAQFLPGAFVPLNTGSSTASPKPAFCHELDCPKFTVLETNDKFEVRHYEPSVWVATSITTFDYTKTESNPMFYKLFHYISGNNTQNTKLAMTAPVVTEIVHGPGPDCESNFTMHFMIPFDMQANPPQPTDPSVYIRYVPELTVIVRSYAGYSDDDMKRQNIEHLTMDLDAAGKQYADNMFFTAGYDGPFSFVRHNEIWVLPKMSI